MAITIFAVLSAQEIFSYFIQNNQNDKDHELLGSFFALPSQQTPVFCARSAGHFRFLLRERATDNKHCSCLYVCASVCFCFVIARRWFFFCSVGLLFFWRVCVYEWLFYLFRFVGCLFSFCRLVLFAFDEVAQWMDVHFAFHSCVRLLDVFISCSVCRTLSCNG